MKTLGILIAAFPVVMLAYAAWSRALRIMRQDAKEAAALKLADSWPPFARAYSTVKGLSAVVCTQNAPWTRPEHGPRAVIVLRRLA